MKHTLYTCLLAVLAGLFIMSCSDDETYAEIAAGILDPAEDPQIQAALEALR